MSLDPALSDPYEHQRRKVYQLAFRGELEYLEKEIENEKKKIIKRRLKLNLNSSQFLDLFLANCKLIMAKQNNQNKLQTDNIESIVNQFYYYATQDKRFEGSFDKGILLIGNYGVGKTLILTAFCNLISTSSRKYQIIHSKELTTAVTVDPESIYNHFTRGGLMIDDLGKEPFVVNTYGTQTIPMEDVLSSRYDSRSITFATANLKLKDFKYSQSIKERMKEMFNIIELKGKSMRL